MAKAMTSRERVLAALNHEEPDRVPIDLGGNQTGIHRDAYIALLKHLGIHDEIQIMDAVQQLARPCEAVLERLRVDTRYVAAGAAADFAGGIEINERGGVVIYGRSDATLNPGGVRIGTAEIYRQVEQLEEIEDSLVVGQDWKGDVRVVLFVKMAEGSDLTDEVKKKIVQSVRANASPRHVPARILAVPEIIYTLNMKKVELAVKKVIQGQEILNKDALMNPEALDFYANIEELQED